MSIWDKLNPDTKLSLASRIEKEFLSKYNSIRNNTSLEIGCDMRNYYFGKKNTRRFVEDCDKIFFAYQQTSEEFKLEPTLEEYVNGKAKQA